MTEPRVIHLEILGKDAPGLQRYYGDTHRCTHVLR